MRWGSAINTVNWMVSITEGMFPASSEAAKSKGQLVEWALKRQCALC